MGTEDSNQATVKRNKAQTRRSSYKHLDSTLMNPSYLKTEKNLRRATKVESFGTEAKMQQLTRVMTNTLLLLMASLVLLADQLSVEGAMSLPDGIENILGFVPRSTFQCERDGYFGDIDNDCRIFHLCQKQVHANGRTEWRHWTYACGNQTMFNQLTLTCAFVDEAIPCKHASQFQYLNEVIHKPREPFLTDADVTSGISYYSNRVMSDGARARAFEDSRLMAQLGGASNLVQEQPIASMPHHSTLPDEHTNLRRATEVASLENSIDQTMQSEPISFLDNFQSLNNQQHHQFATFAQQPAAGTTQLPQIQFAPATIATPSQQIQHTALNHQQQAAPNSFEFSIATNHQHLAGPASVFISNIAQTQSAPSPVQVITERNLAATTTLAPLRQQETTTTATRQSVTTTTTSLPTTNAAPQLQTTTRLPVSESPVVATTTQRAQVQQQPRRRQTSRKANQQQPSRQQQQARQTIFDHQLNGMFQSTRLSSAQSSSNQPSKSNRQQQQQQQQQQRPALVMRRHTQADAASAAAGPPGNNFWRQPFEALTMANRFDSMLTRRRV